MWIPRQALATSVSLTLLGVVGTGVGLTLLAGCWYKVCGYKCGSYFAGMLCVQM